MLEKSKFVCYNKFAFIYGEIAQLARAIGSYPCGQMSYRLIMAGYINWLDSSVHTRNVGGSSPSLATKWKLKSV